MKKIILFLMLGALSTACVSRQSADRMQNDIDSLQAQVKAKEALIDDVFASIGAITANLEEIKSREGLLTLTDGELSDSTSTERITRDLEAIDNLLAENRTRIAELEKKAEQLRKANHKIKGLERLIEELNTQVATRDGEIGRLKERIEGLNLEIADLGERVAAKEAEVQTLSSEKAQLQTEVTQKTSELHTAHYIIAPEKQLVSDMILEKKGFIGRTLVVAEKPNMALFTEADTRLLKTLAIGQKEVTLITSHPEGSYWLVESEENKKEIESLVILDAEQFWSLSKILVISHK
ncbi:MAG: hypothetical protein E7137_05880 [Rikenellaceae bacterium]|nr:hypothetical protein [Rikenellaceae bacterium]